MPSIEIKNMNGDVEWRELSKSHPLAFGRHRSSDIRIDERGVAAMHCRISWNKTAYEVTAAGTDGVDVNGTLVRHWLLSVGDIIRIGSCDIVFHKENGTKQQTKDVATEDKESPKSADKSTFGLRPITEDEIPAFMVPSAGKVKETASAADSKTKKKTKKQKQGEKEDVEEFDDSTAQEEVEKYLEGVEDYLEDEPDEIVEDFGNAESDRWQSSSARDQQKQEEAQPKAESPLERMKSKLKAPPRRPGEQDIVRSPLVLILGGGAVVLLLLAGIFWFIIGRETVQRQFDRAKNLREEGNYTQAISAFEKFIATNSKHASSDEARIQLAETRIAKEISGSRPSWSKGMEALDAARDKIRDLDGFSDWKPSLCTFSKKIATGAAKAAGSRKLRDLLKVSDSARAMLERYSPTEEPPKEALANIANERRIAEAIILKQETFDNAIASIDTAIEDQKPMDALVARRQLITRYPDFESHSGVQDALRRTLEAEQQLVKIEQLNREAIHEDHPSEFPKPLTLARHARSRTDEASRNRTVVAVAADCCFGIDTVTGSLLWRRVIGLDTPFLPIEAKASVRGRIMFDSNRKELVCVDAKTGGLLWRQPLEEEVSGAPVIDENQLFLPTRGGHVYAIDVETGRIATRLTLSQELFAPPALFARSKQMVIVGHEQLLYTISTLPLECVSVSYLGHGPGAIDAPPVAMGSLLLIAENDRVKSCRLRVLEFQGDKRRLTQITEERVNGQVRDAPFLRGKQLFVPASPERIYAYTVSDDDKQRTLTYVDEFQEPTGTPGPLHLLGGSDGQLWLAGSLLHKLRMTTESLKLEPYRIAIGMSSQALQSSGDTLFVHRKSPTGGGVIFLPASHRDLAGEWQVALGTRILAALDSGDDLTTCVTSNGDVFVIRPNEFRDGGFKSRAQTELKPSAASTSPLKAAPIGNGRVAVCAGAPNPVIWIINAAGQIEKQIKLKEPAELPPVALGNGIVIPLPGRLHFETLGPQAKPVGDYLAEIKKDETRRWTALQRVDDSHVVAADDQGKLVRIQLRTQGDTFLAQVAELKLGNAVDVGFVTVDRKIVIADAGKKLRVIDSASLAPLDEVTLDQKASNRLWTQGKSVFVEVGASQLKQFQLADKLAEDWSIALDGSSLADQPFETGDGRVVIAKVNGEIIVVKSDTGEEISRKRLAQPITLGPRRSCGFVVVGTLDGSFIRIDSLLETASE